MSEIVLTKSADNGGGKPLKKEEAACHPLLAADQARLGTATAGDLIQHREAAAGVPQARQLQRFLFLFSLFY
jgi:hypothetical protein